jgi:hypothetical protein
MSVHVLPQTPRTEIVPVATNDRLSLHAKQLAEDFFELRKFERIQRAFMRRLERTLVRVESNDARRSLQELVMVLPDVFRDASFLKLMRDAREVAGEADIRFIRRKVGL